MSTDRQIADKIVKSAGYQLTVLNPVDRAKVEAAANGERRPSPGAALAQAAWELYLRKEPATPPPPPTLAEIARNIMFTAQAPEAALRCPQHWRIAISADPAYDTAARAAAPKIKAAGHLLAVWGVQTQVGVDRIRDLGRNVGADFLIFQAETPDEYDTAMAAGASVVIGNPNNWTDAQRADATARGNTVAHLFEVYANEGSQWPDEASSRGVPITSEVLGVGFGANPYQLRDYLARTPPSVWPTISVYAAGYMTDESWGLLP